MLVFPFFLQQICILMHYDLACQICYCANDLKIEIFKICNKLKVTFSRVENMLHFALTLTVSEIEQIYICEVLLPGEFVTSKSKFDTATL